MTASVQRGSTSSSRRTVLAGVLGGLGAWAAAAIGRASPVAAADGTFDSVFAKYVESVNVSAARAIYADTTSNQAAVEAHNAGTGPGVSASSTSGFGVFGGSISGRGVEGSSTSSYGVIGYSSATDQPACVGRSNGDSSGVLGHSGTGGLPAAKAKTGVYGIATQDSTSKGVWGNSTGGHGIHGTATTGYAGYFAGKVYVSKFQEMPEISTPPAPGANKARLFVRDDGSGKTQLCVRFSAGAIRVLATQA